MNNTENFIGEYPDKSNWSDIDWLSKITLKKVTQAELKLFNGIGQVSNAKQVFLKTDSGEEIIIFTKVIPESKKSF